MPVRYLKIVCISILLIALAAQTGCEQSQPGAKASRSDNKQGKSARSSEKATTRSKVSEARKAEVIRKMQHDLKAAKKARAVAPPAEVRKNLVGAWRLDAMLRDGKWKSWRQAGKSHDIEFRGDGTVQAYLLTHQLDGSYETSPGDGCVDVLMTLGKTPFTYSFSITFEDGKLIMGPWERTEFRKNRMFKSIEAARDQNGLERYYRVSGFRADN